MSVGGGGQRRTYSREGTDFIDEFTIILGESLELVHLQWVGDSLGGTCGQLLSYAFITTPAGNRDEQISFIPEVSLASFWLVHEAFYECFPMFRA